MSTLKSGQNTTAPYIYGFIFRDFRVVPIIKVVRNDEYNVPFSNIAFTLLRVVYFLISSIFEILNYLANLFNSNWQLQVISQTTAVITWNFLVFYLLSPGV